MKFCYKNVIILVFFVANSTVYSADYVKKKIWGAEPETRAELIQKSPLSMELIRSEDVRDKKLAGLLDQAIPTGKLELYNPPNIINQTIKLVVGGKEKSYIIDQFHLWHTHWVCENNWRLLLGLCGAYAVFTYLLPTVAIVAVVGGGAFYLYKNSSASEMSGADEHSATINRVAQTLGVNETTLTSTVSTATSRVGLTNTLGQILSQQEETFLAPTYKINKEGQVECIYDGALKQGYGKLLGYHIVLRLAS